MIKDVSIHRMDKHLFVRAVTSLAQSPRTPFLDNFRGADDATGNPWRAQSAKVTHTRTYPPALAGSEVCLVGVSA